MLSVAALGERFVAMNSVESVDTKEDDNDLSKVHQNGAPPVLVELRDPEGEGANLSVNTPHSLLSDLNRFDLDLAVKGHFAGSAAALIEHFSLEPGAGGDKVALFEEYLPGPPRPPTASKMVSLGAWAEAGAMEASPPPRVSTLDLDAWEGAGADLSFPSSDVSPSRTPKSPLENVLERAITHSAVQRRSTPGVDTREDAFKEYLPRRPAPPSSTKRIDMTSWEGAGSEVPISSANVPPSRPTSMKVEERRPPKSPFAYLNAMGHSLDSQAQSNRGAPGIGFDAARFTPAQGAERSLSSTGPAVSPHIDLDFLGAGPGEYKADGTQEDFDRESAALSRKASYMKPFKHDKTR